MLLNTMSEKVSRLAKMLASDELKTRKLGHKLALKLLRVKAKTENSELTYENILGVCKGLHYSLWMQDKLLLQEDTVERICKLLPVITSRETRVNFVSAMFETLAREWENLDVWRADKFMLLAREFFVKTLMCTQKRALPVSAVADAVFNKVLNSNPNAAIDLKVHLCTVVAEELTRRKDLTAVIVSFYKRTLDVLLTIARGNDYITCLTRLLLILARLVRANRSVRSELSENALLLSTKHPLHRKTLCRIARILHLKKKQKSKSPTDQTADPNALPKTLAEDAMAAPEISAKIAVKRDPSKPSCDPVVTTTAAAAHKKIKKKNRKRKHAVLPDPTVGAPESSATLSADYVAAAATSELPTEMSPKCEKMLATSPSRKPSPELLPQTVATGEEAKASTESSLNCKKSEKDSTLVVVKTPSPSSERRNRKRRRSSSLTEPVVMVPVTDEQTPNYKDSSLLTPSGANLTPQTPKQNSKNRKRRRGLGSIDLEASPANKTSSFAVITNATMAAQAGAISTANAGPAPAETKKKTTPVEGPALAEPKSLVESTSPRKSSLSSPVKLPSRPTTGEVNGSTDMMLAAFDESLAEPPVSAKKRVSFGKVFRKRFSANRSLTISPSLTAIPDRGILRQQSS
uniref:Ribosomal RNA processing protein 1 homolog n=1 Tax=Schistocephalus solidus TaxID=70667 RepID=A0A0X3NXA1_SCHSO